ncbi:MAG TPA: TonB-dependent receptor [Phnomibacter sp.]|nr:TonB-dependent receptor [Phnomibacter sp.]
MKPTLATLVLLFFAFGVQAQHTQLKGTVTDTRNRPLAGASVSIKDSYDGCNTDSLGHFSFSTSDTGVSILSISSIGYKPWQMEIRLTGSTQQFEVVLKESMNELTAVMVTAGAFEAGDEKKTTVLKPLDIVTTASANADITAAMKTLPGTQQVGESAELFVRGGEGYETRQFIDGTTVANPFFGSAPNIASRGRFSPFLFKGTVFSSGGYSALYGQALSSALILESIDLPENSSASASIAPILVGAQYQDLAKNKKSSWGVSAQYVNIGLYYKLVPQRPDYFHAPEVVSGDVNFRVKTSATGMLKFYGNYARNVLGLRNPDIDMASLKNSFSLDNGNIYTNLSYKERLTGRLKLHAGFSFSQNLNDIKNQVVDEDNNPVPENTLPVYVAAKNYTVDATNNLWQGRAVLDYKLKGLSSIKMGAEYWYSKDISKFNRYKSTMDDEYKAAFAEADIYITNRLAARAGLRAEKVELIHATNLAPRASLSYKLGTGTQLSADYGVFYQKPQPQYLLFDQHMPQMRADHYILTFQKLGLSKTFRMQLFEKDYKQLTRLNPDTTHNGTGYARGIELFWRDKITFKNFDYWVTYSYLNTKRNYLNFPYEMTPNFAAEHTANLVVKRFFTKLNLQFNVNYQFATGRPYYDIHLDGSTQKWSMRDQGTTIAYNNLSLSLNYITKIGKAFSVVVFSMNNVLNSKQVYGYTYSFDGTNKIPTLPPANQFFFAGLFLSWGTDRTQDAINNNL